MDSLDKVLRAVMIGLSIGALYITLTLIGRFWRWLRNSAVQDVGRAAGSIAGVTAKNSRKLADSFKDEFSKHS